MSLKSKRKKNKFTPELIREVIYADANKKRKAFPSKRIKVDELIERNISIVISYYINGDSTLVIAQRVGISYQRVNQIVRRYKKLLSKPRRSSKSIFPFFDWFM